MTVVDFFLLSFIFLLFLGALLFMKRNGTCTGNCENCRGVCTSVPKRTKNAVPPFVEAYYKDHYRQNV